MLIASTGLLTEWESFYVIVGSSGAALIGLQFVVITLIAALRTRSSHATIGAFGTPTIVHFGAALVVAATMSAPWPSLRGVALMLCAVGLVGMVYSVITTVRAARQEGYTPVWEDWLWHAILPFAAYLAILIAGWMVPTTVGVTALFVIAAAALLLLFIGIHNAWDTVTFIVIDHASDLEEPSAR